MSEGNGRALREVTSTGKTGGLEDGLEDQAPNRSNMEKNVTQKGKCKELGEQIKGPKGKFRVREKKQMKARDIA